MFLFTTFKRLAEPASCSENNQLANVSRPAAFINIIATIRELLKGRDGRDGLTRRDGLPGHPGVPGRDGQNEQ